MLVIRDHNLNLNRKEKGTQGKEEKGRRSGSLNERWWDEMRRRDFYYIAACTLLRLTRSTFDTKVGTSKQLIERSDRENLYQATILDQYC